MAQIRMQVAGRYDNALLFADFNWLVLLEMISEQ